jgi:cytochrome c oxidase assembly protein subunit 15
MLGVVMTIIQIALGGITRLTGSGLSITEWDVVTGTLPPLNDAAWLVEFEKYKATPQFRLLNADFSLPDFKFIFFWEWFHRLWARLIGVVFAAGFIFFWVRKYFQPRMVTPLVILFLLGALQGAVGWIMVASGLTGDAIFVKPTRLALHFIFALALLAYTAWFALALRVPHERRINAGGARKLALVILGLLTLQLIYGALMAGHKAATAAPTWPDINGALLAPPGWYRPDHGLLNLVDNKIMVHVVHRGLAYLLALVTLWYALQLKKLGGAMARHWWWPLLVVVLQIALGVGAVLTSTGIIPNEWLAFEWLAQIHQLVGVAFMLVVVYGYYLTSGGKQAA